MNRPIVSGRDPEAVARALADRVAVRANEAARRSGRFAIAIPGGSTPERFFRILAAEFRTRIPWDRVHVFWTDERAVAPDRPESNYALAERTLLAPLDLPASHRHRMRANPQRLDASALEDEQELRMFFGAPSEAAEGSTFDFVVLGVGPDGHTASLFPGASTLEATDRWVLPEPNPRHAPLVPRVTLTLPVLRGAAEVAFLVCGSEKQAILEQILRPRAGTPLLPAARVAARGSVSWFVDEAALPPAAGPGSRT